MVIAVDELRGQLIEAFSDLLFCEAICGFLDPGGMNMVIQDRDGNPKHCPLSEVPPEHCTDIPITDASSARYGLLHPFRHTMILQTNLDGRA